MSPPANRFLEKKIPRPSPPQIVFEYRVFRSRVYATKIVVATELVQLKNIIKNFLIRLCSECAFII